MASYQESHHLSKPMSWICCMQHASQLQNLYDSCSMLSHLVPTMLFAETSDKTIMEGNGFVHDCSIPAYHTPGNQIYPNVCQSACVAMSSTGNWCIQPEGCSCRRPILQFRVLSLFLSEEASTYHSHRAVEPATSVMHNVISLKGLSRNLHWYSDSVPGLCLQASWKA